MGYEAKHIILRELEEAKLALLDARIKEAMSQAGYDVCLEELGKFDSKTQAYRRALHDEQRALLNAQSRFERGNKAINELTDGDNE